MTSTDSDETRYERQGRAVRRTYTDFSLTSEQRERHKLQLREASQQGTSRFALVSAETVAIGAAALLLVITIAVWQSLEPRSSETPGETQTESIIQSDRDTAAADREAAMPFPPHETCPANDWAGPENRLGGQYPDSLDERGPWTYSYFLDGSGISLNARLGLLFEGENAVVWLLRTYLPQDIAFSAERLDGDSGPAIFQFDQRITAEGESDGVNLTVHSGTVTFPEPGCWQITVDSQDAGLRQTIYVYPAETRRPDSPAS